MHTAQRKALMDMSLPQKPGSAKANPAIPTKAIY